MDLSVQQSKVNYPILNMQEITIDQMIEFVI